MSMEKRNEPEEVARPHRLPALQLVCPECGELLEVRDVYALLQAIHLKDACPNTRPILGES